MVQEHVLQVRRSPALALIFFSHLSSPLSTVLLNFLGQSVIRKGRCRCYLRQPFRKELLGLWMLISCRLFLVNDWLGRSMFLLWVLLISIHFPWIVVFLVLLKCFSLQAHQTFLQHMVNITLFLTGYLFGGLFRHVVFNAAFVFILGRSLDGE